MNDYGYTPSQVAAKTTAAYSEIAHLLGETLIDPAEGQTLGDYLREHNVGRYFSVKEITTPHHKRLAKELGYDSFTPPVHLWPLVAIVVRIADLCRGTVGRSVSMRNLWRPAPYNMRVTGSSSRSRSLRGDHANCCACDLDFQDATDRRKAEGLCRGLSAAFPGLQMSLGMGTLCLHVGVLSPRGHRHWYYSYAGRKYKVLP